MPPWMYANLKPCGTTAAYDRHIRHGEPACKPCREANARRWREQNQLKTRRPKTRRPKPAATEPAGWQPTYIVDVLALLDICEAIDGPPYEWRREYLDECGGAA